MAKSRRRKPPTIHLELERHEAESLVGLARFYERSMGPARHVVRLTAGARFRAKYRFMAEESHVLEQFARSVVEQMDAGGQERTEVSMTVPAAVAFWGRAIASLASRRSRRKLKEAGVTGREALAAKLQGAVSHAARQDRRAVAEAISTRPSAEADTMRAALGLGAEDPPGAELAAE